MSSRTQTLFLYLWGTAEFLDVLTDHVERGVKAAFVTSQKDVRTTLSNELDAALSQRLYFPAPLLKLLDTRGAIFVYFW